MVRFRERGDFQPASQASDARHVRLEDVRRLGGQVVTKVPPAIQRPSNRDRDLQLFAQASMGLDVFPVDWLRKPVDPHLFFEEMPHGKGRRVVVALARRRHPARCLRPRPLEPG